VFPVRVPGVGVTRGPVRPRQHGRGDTITDVDERLLTEHSSSADTDVFPAVPGGDPAAPAEAAAPGAPAGPAGPDATAAPGGTAEPVPPAAAAPSPLPPAADASSPVPPPPAPAAGPASLWYQAPYAIVLAVVVGGLVWTWQGTVRAGMVTVAAGLLAAALARLVLPERQAGLLVSRHRMFDVTILLGLGVCILVVALVLPRSALSPV
jgi:hypothetical protein